MGCLGFHTQQAIIRQLFSKPGVQSEKVEEGAGTAVVMSATAISVKDTGDSGVPSSLGNNFLSSGMVTEGV